LCSQTKSSPAYLPFASAAKNNIPKFIQKGCPWESQQVNVESQRATGTVRRSMQLGPRYLFDAISKKKYQKRKSWCYLAAILV
jgi:hypothetical protein